MTVRSKFFLRVHMFVIVGGTVAAGLLVTKILLITHERNLAFRYGLAVVLAFAAFLGFIKLWLRYVAHCVARKSASSGGIDWVNVGDFDVSGVSTGGGIDGPDIETGAGSSFGGGGAGGSWGAPVSKIGDICDSDELGVVILVAVLVLAIALSAVYVIWAAPTILSEAALPGALAAALTRRAKKISSDASCVGSVFRATVVPFAVVLIFAVALGWYAQKHCPSAMRLRDALHCVAR